MQVAEFGVMKNAGIASVGCDAGGHLALPDANHPAGVAGIPNDVDPLRGNVAEIDVVKGAPLIFLALDPIQAWHFS
jgi:hypothetical protein